METTLQYEMSCWTAGKQFIAGVDEVGRGPLAGPVLACAVIFPKDYFLSGVRDSKKLSPRRRCELATILKREALCWATGRASVQEIDQFNIRQATFMAMRRAVENLSAKPDQILVDGENLPDSPCDAQGIIKGDDISFTVASASIIAKVERDRIMQEIDIHYPVYHFAKNKGYGTREHIGLLKVYGPCIHHRHTFLKKIFRDF